jgi:hypothetical protein
MKNKLFAKLMMKTTSDNDAEALLFLRKANKILADAKINWAELLDAVQADQSYRVPPSQRRPRPEPEWNNVGDHTKYTDHPEIDGLFNRVLDKPMSEGFESFITSVHIWWQQKGFLTEAQYKALKRAAERE